MGTRCLWDSDTDNYASDVFMNDSLFCCAAAFGISDFKIMLSEIEFFCASLVVAFKSMRSLSLLSLNMQR